MVSAVLWPLTAGRVYLDVAPSGAVRPFITLRAAGGTPITFLDGTIPAKEIVRVEVSVWGSGRADAADVGKKVEDALRAATALQTTVLTGRSAIIDSATQIPVMLQEFEIFV
ncbi:tail completion protein gp17 [Massilia frigida]|nr:DUF3168 domain-containing protein [Massilia frigida]